QQHLNEEQLIELYYAQAGDGNPSQAHIESCKACAEDYQQLRAALATVTQLPVPERGEGYGREVYARLLPRLEEQEIEQSAAKRWGWLNPFRSNWAGAAAMAMLLLVAFFAGRAWQAGFKTRILVGKDQPVQQQPVQERVLLVALGDH